MATDEQYLDDLLKMLENGTVEEDAASVADDTKQHDKTDNPEEAASVSIADPEAELPDDLQFPEDTALPDDLQFPEDSVLPDDLQFPEDTALPDDLQFPEDSVLPDDLQFPEDTALPDDLQFPEDTALPDDLQFPEDTALPDDLQFPEDTALPDDLLMPEDTALFEDLPVPEDAAGIEALQIPEDMSEAEVMSALEEALLSEESLNQEEALITEESGLTESISPEEDGEYANADNDSAEKMLTPQELDAIFAEMDGQVNPAEVTPDQDAAEEEDDEIPEDLLALLNEPLAEPPSAGADEAFASGNTDETGSLSGVEFQPADVDEMEIGDLIAGMNDDEDLSEIKGLLDKAESNEPVDDEMMTLLSGISDYGDENSSEDGDDLLSILETDSDINDGTSEEGESKGRKKPKRKKKKTGAADADINEFGELTPEAEQKTGFFKRILAALTAADDDEEEHAGVDGEVQSISDENKDILTELDKEDRKDAKAKKGKKAKKDKKDKNKKADGAEAKERGEEEEDSEDSGKKKKPKKEKKKKPAEEETLVKEKKVSPKKVMLVAAFCSSMAAVIIVLCQFIPDFKERVSARQAYYENNYEEVYRNFYGKSLSQNDEIIFNQAQVVLKMGRKTEAYRNYQAMNMPAEALNALLQGVKRYEELRNAGMYGSDAQVQEIYLEILDILSMNYNISEQDALDILSYDEVSYAQMVYSYALGSDFVYPTEPGAGETEGGEISEGLEDILPEEEDMIP